MAGAAGSGERPVTHQDAHHRQQHAARKLGTENAFLTARVDRDEARFWLDEDPDRSATLLASARLGFATVGARYWGAAATAELAGVCSFLKRYADMLAFRDEALAVLAAIPLHREASLAVLCLGSLPSEEPSSAGSLTDLRSCLDVVTQERVAFHDFRQPEETPP